ncbi:hypothetical protein KR51_00003550 [Rubidibacter lacunae KORDI 51-2]|uniref:Uncharacterized protein n=1 Tax=Rubidibacter lacunae KORDI 51-2 TaxID=582515 RepID=U5DQZ2_9CHRO|nr:hypothetical protein KR51_00003550 [Rubidibacter lacunae KORDI 51-2]
MSSPTAIACPRSQSRKSSRAEAQPANFRKENSNWEGRRTNSSPARCKSPLMLLDLVRMEHASNSKFRRNTEEVNLQGLPLQSVRCLEQSRHQQDSVVTHPIACPRSQSANSSLASSSTTFKLRIEDFNSKREREMLHQPRVNSLLIILYLSRIWYASNSKFRRNTDKVNYQRS